MSITKCPHCDNTYDQDFNAEHEEMCGQPVNREARKNMARIKSPNPSGLVKLSAMYFMGMIGYEEYLGERRKVLETRLK